MSLLVRDVDAGICQFAILYIVLEDKELTL